MPPLLRKIIMLLISTLALWASAGIVYATNLEDFYIVAAIMAFLGSMALWLVFGLTEISDKTKSATLHTKAKRDSERGEDARLALMLSLMTPDERDELKARLADELQADGEAISLADLLANNNADYDQFTDSPV